MRLRSKPRRCDRPCCASPSTSAPCSMLSRTLSPTKLTLRCGSSAARFSCWLEPWIVAVEHADQEFFAILVHPPSGDDDLVRLGAAQAHVRMRQHTDALEAFPNDEVPAPAENIERHGLDP